MYRFFTLDELVSLWEKDNDSLYERWGNSIEKGYAKALTAKPLVKDIIEKADEALAGGRTAADLRFGHDMSYMALLSLLGIDADGGQRYRSAEAHKSWFGFQIVPTAANLQIVFYRKGDDVIFKMLRNEQEVAIPGMKAVSGPYYSWADFKEKFTPSDKVGIEFDKDNFITLRNTIGTAKGPVEVVYKAYMHLPYVTAPVDVAHQSLSIFEPIMIGGKRVDASHSPILFSNRVNGYLPVDDSETSDLSNDREKLALAEGMVVVVPGCRGRTLKDENGRNIGKAPAVLVDLKAAIRYLRHNKGLIPGDTEKIVSAGCSAGGAVSAAIGASGNSPLFKELLEEVGAAPERDDVFATGAFSPIMDLQHADMAYEWEFGTSPRRGEMVDQELSLSLREQFAQYQKSLRMRGNDDFGQVTADNLGEYMALYWLNPSATLFLEGLTEGKRSEYLKDRSWLGWDGNKTNFSWETYLGNTTQRVKGIPAFDAFDGASPENSLFGDATNDTAHFTEFSLRHTSNDAEASLDEGLQRIVDMMNPLTFIRGRNTGCSQHWWIRHGAAESGNSRASVVYMATELAGQGKKVNAALFWDAGHCQDKDPQGFIDWIVSITAPRDEAIREKLLDPSGKEVLTGCSYGDWHGTMENSLHAIQKAFDKGADIVSLGLKKTADGKIICFSDDTVDRLLDGAGKVSEMTLEQIRTLSPRSYSGPSDWTVVPTLEEAIAFSREKVLLHIDLQDNIDDILEIVRREKAEKNVVFKRNYPGEGFYYLPVFDVEHHPDCTELERLLSLNPVGIEIHWTKDDAPLLEEAFRMVRGRTRIAVNTGNGKAGSYHDPKGREGSPEQSWGKLIKDGASIIFTDGIKPLTRYLDK